MGDVNTVGLKRNFVTLCRDLGGIGVDRHGKLSSKVPECLRVDFKKGADIKNRRLFGFQASVGRLL